MPQTDVLESAGFTQEYQDDLSSVMENDDQWKGFFMAVAGFMVKNELYEYPPRHVLQLAKQCISLRATIERTADWIEEEKGLCP